MYLDMPPWSNEAWARRFFTKQMNYEKFKIGSWIIEVLNIDPWKLDIKSNLSQVLGHLKFQCSQVQNDFSEVARLGNWSCLYKSWGGVESFYKSDVLKICAHEVGSEQHQNKKVDFKSSYKNWSWYFNLGHNKRSEVLLHHLPIFKSQTCSQVLLLRKKLQQVPISFPHIGK